VIEFDARLPAIRQVNGWSCFVTSLRWCAASLGQPVGRRAAERLVLRQQIISPHGNLVDKTGAELAHFASQELDISASYVDGVSFDEVALEAGRWPLVLGGLGWQHYAAVRAYSPELRALILANPLRSPWLGVARVLTRARFDALRPLVMVRVLPKGLGDAVHPPRLWLPDRPDAGAVPRLRGMGTGADRHQAGDLLAHA
jgi:hypothetical protein